MWNLHQTVSELEETPRASSEPSSAPPVVNERKHTMETLQTERDWPLCSTQTRRSTKTHESRISYSLSKEEGDFRFPEKRNGLQFPIVETTTEFYESEAVESSSDEEFYAFDDGDARPGPLHNQHLYRMKPRNAELCRTACDKMSPPQRDEERIRMRREEMAQERKQSRDRSHYQESHSPNQGNPRDRSHYHMYQASHSSNQANPRGYSRANYQVSYSPNANTRGACSPHRVQDRNEKRTSRTQTIRSSVYLQQNIQLEETGLPKRRNECSNRAVKTLPPIQQRRTKAASPRQLHGPKEHRSQPSSPARRCGRQEVCEERSSEYCWNRRVGVCKQTDTTQGQRTFVRVLGKRF